MGEFTLGFDMALSEKELDNLPYGARQRFLFYCYKDKDTHQYILCLDDARFSQNFDKLNKIQYKVKPEQNSIRKGGEAMKSLMKFDWLLIISVPVIAVYLWAAMFTNVLSGRPFGSGAEGWFGSFTSVLIGLLFLFLWVILALIRAAKLLHEEYGELTPQEKMIVGRISGHVAGELIRRAKRRRDKIGSTVRFVLRVTRP